MTKQDKAELRALIRRGDRRSDEELARVIGCTAGTVGKYRRALAPKAAK